MELPQHLNFGISAHKSTYSLGFIGTQGTYAEALWVNKSTFIVVGFYLYYHPNDENINHGCIPFIIVFNFKSPRRYERIEYIGTPIFEERDYYEGKLFKKIEFE